MTDEQVRPEYRKISIEDAIRFKHGQNRSIRYRGLNAQEIVRLKRIGQEDWDRARKSFGELIRTSGGLKDVYLYGSGVLLLAAAIFLPAARWPILTLLAIVCAGIGKRHGQAGGYQEGFFAGYANGVDDGVDKALGIDENDAKKIQDRAAEMDLDEMTIKKWDESSRPALRR